jgi:hypothetical protein
MNFKVYGRKMQCRGGGGRGKKKKKKVIDIKDTSSRV